MKPNRWPYKIMVLLVITLAWGCTVPNPSSSLPPLSAATAQQAIDRWNPGYCKVVEFYGFHQSGDAQMAFVLIANPADPSSKPMVYEARFLLLTRPDGAQQWFFTSLVNHAGGLSRRQGWDNLFIPVKAEPGSQ